MHRLSDCEMQATQLLRVPFLHSGPRVVQVMRIRMKVQQACEWSQEEILGRSARQWMFRLRPALRNFVALLLSLAVL